jgi:DNA-directed RNA polymerase specialized sigma24 family protein
MTRCVQLIEEIVNDTMLVVWQKAHRFDGTSKVSTWIFAIAYRKACKAIKGLDEPVGVALDDLPAAQRTVIQLTYHHDMGYADIAEIMDCPVNTVKTRMFHARRRLRLVLAGHLEETV